MLFLAFMLGGLRLPMHGYSTAHSLFAMRVQEDPSFSFARDEETNQTVIQGMGEFLAAGFTAMVSSLGVNEH